MQPVFETGFFLGNMKTVSEIHEKQLFKRMQTIGIREQDIKESFVRSSAPGGQNVNKVATCVCLRHRPTGMVVKCQKFRTQGMNRLLARQILLERIERRHTEQHQAKVQQIQKLKRQKRKRSHSLKERILESKRIRSKKKAGRRAVRIIQDQ